MSRRLMHVAAFAAYTVIAALAQAQGVTQGASSSAARAAINTLWDDVIAGIKRGDAAAVAAIYTSDGMIVNTSMPTLTGRASIERSARDWLSSTKVVPVSRTRASLEIHGDVAIENGTYVQTLEEKGERPTRNEGHYIMVFKNTGGRWLTYVRVETPLSVVPVRK